MNIEDCSRGVGALELEWSSNADLGARRHVAITFSPTAGSAYFKITGIHPFVFEWPDANAEPGAHLRARVPAFGRCKESSEPAIVELDFPSIDRNSCWYPIFGDRRWCDVPLAPGEKRYIVRKFGPSGFRLERSFEISQRGDELPACLRLWRPDG